MNSVSKYNRACVEFMDKYIDCHTQGKESKGLMKYFYSCAPEQAALDKCMKDEYKKRWKENFEKSKITQEKLREKLFNNPNNTGQWEERQKYKNESK